MSLKNYIFATINTKSTTTFQSRGEEPSSVDTTTSTDIEGDSSESSMNWIKKVWSFITIEPVMVCWILPSCLLYIAIENLSLEKSCRVNYGYSDLVCDNMIDKSINNIDCVEVRGRMKSDTNESMELDHDLFYNTTRIKSFNGSEVVDLKFTLTDLEEDVCKAEVDSQILDSALNVYTAPFDTVFGILMILFAGGWSDKKGKRKPCMLLPLIGETASLVVLLISAIFMKQLPLEFNMILSKLLPAMGGGQNLMLMGVYSYLTEMTAEKDRTFRFGIFAVFVPLIPVVSLPWSGILFQSLGYVKLLLLCIPINVLGVLYIIFILKEVDHSQLKSTNGTVANGTTEGTDNPGFELKESATNISSTNGNGTSSPTQVITALKKNAFVEFFNPVVAVGCIQVILRKREYNGRVIIWLLLITYFIAIGPAFGEEPNEYNFTRIVLNWGGLQYSPFATYGNFISLIGTTLMVGGLSKLFHLSDPLVGFLGTLFSGASRIFYAAATTSFMLYVARTVDMFVSVRALTLKSIISIYVDSTELGRIFSIIGIIEAFAKFVYVSVYSLIYQYTLESLPSAFYICSLFCLVIVAIMFAFLYFIVKKKHAREVALSQQQATMPSNPTNSEVWKSSTEQNTHM
ncbi:Proton-coupled folate transporter [Pseudolycoriella hygida]|uniref:Proton-coupled folate transporter n=1 Tax=Pseudolycoriella hygida TaxID=35572 RepID=A0A9Q0MR01_9DIPT|nr:Proton-coupled folate transporter [Pseudolycoriella hygida]